MRVGFSGEPTGERRDVLEALREGGPTKRVGAGRRAEGVRLILSVVDEEAIMGDGGL